MECVLKGSYRISAHVASRENIPHTVRAATAQAISDELPEESTSSWSLRCTACHSPGRIVRFPLVSAFGGVLSCQRCDHGMVTETEEDTPSAMLRMSVSLRKGATFRPGVHVREGKSRRNPCTGGLKERSNTGVSDETCCSGSLDAQKAAEAGAMSAGCSCNAVYCTAALTLTSRREQRARNTDHSQHPFPTPTCSRAQSESCAWL